MMYGCGNAAAMVVSLFSPTMQTAERLFRNQMRSHALAAVTGEPVYVAAHAYRVCTPRLLAISV
jgi:hypothetical protein